MASTVCRRVECAPKGQAGKSASQIDLQRDSAPRRSTGHHLARLDQRIQNLHFERPTLKENTMADTTVTTSATGGLATAAQAAEKVVETIAKIEGPILAGVTIFVPGTAPITIPLETILPL